MSHGHSEQHHHGGPVIYTGTLTGLLILTGITVGASYINFGSNAANIAIALTIASIKAILVALFFMHLKWDKPVNAIIAITGFLFLGIFITFDLIDLNNRRDPTPRNVPVMATPTAVPDSMVPQLTPAPKPYPKKEVPAEGKEE
jgi:cytochrome c oxidase subunit 4